MKIPGKTRAQMTILAIAVLAVVGAGTVLARGPGDGRGHGDGRGYGHGEGQGLERLAERLDLTTEQQEAIAAIHAQVRKDGLALRKEMRRLRHELAGKLMEDEPDAKQVRGLVERIGAKETELDVQRVERRLAVRAVLTPEQRDLMLAMGAGAGHGRHRGGRHAGGRHHGGGQRACPLDDD